MYLITFLLTFLPDHVHQLINCTVGTTLEEEGEYRRKGYKSNILSMSLSQFTLSTAAGSQELGPQHHHQGFRTQPGKEESKFANDTNTTVVVLILWHLSLSLSVLKIYCQDRPEIKEMSIGDRI